MNVDFHSKKHPGVERSKSVWKSCTKGEASEEREENNSVDNCREDNQERWKTHSFTYLLTEVMEHFTNCRLLIVYLPLIRLHVIM